jgi:hypothetical protein
MDLGLCFFKEALGDLETRILDFGFGNRKAEKPRGCHFLRRREEPVMAEGFGNPSISRRVGATSAKMPSAIWYFPESEET